MEIRQWAIHILGGLTLEDKLFCPEILTDLDPGEPIFWSEPSRPASLAFKKFTKQEKLPPFHEHNDPYKRAICLHRFAGHELLAVELMAYALLAFPSMPKHFRKGLANTLKEEQWHVKIYQKRLLEMGTVLGDHPLNGRFWQLTPHLTTPLKYLSAIHLTLEMANLDFAPHYGASFERHGDSASSDLMKQIFSDELSHVGFGYFWLNKCKDTNLCSYDAWLSSLPDILPAKRAKGFIFQEKARLDAGLPKDWVSNLQKL
jgi:uncharacterized ferritin-like protein (DUF455 family)